MELNVLEHVMVPEHHLVPEKDEEKVLKEHNVRKDNLPKIRKSDPCIKVLEEYYGDEIKEGRLIRIVRSNSVAGVSVTYRIVVRG
jgi:DNA-directed RNA polymerase subunit H